MKIKTLSKNANILDASGYITLRNVGVALVTTQSGEKVYVVGETSHAESEVDEQEDRLILLASNSTVLL
jgi:hypothetical protein